MEELITEGDEFYERALSAIRAAESTVYLEMYIFADDEIGREFQTALADAARAGRKVIVIYDRVGSFSTPAGFWRELSDAGVFVYPYLPGVSRWLRTGRGLFRLWSRLARALRALRRGFLRRNHRKTLIVDRRIAFTGGFNIMRECSRRIVGDERWLDTMYITDRPILAHALESYFRDTLQRIRGARRESGADFDAVRKRVREAILYPAHAARALRLRLPALALWNGARVTYDRNQAVKRKGLGPHRPGLSPGYVRMSIPRAFKKLLFHSRRRIWLTYPYFVPYGGMLRLLHRKAGVTRPFRGRANSVHSVDLRIYLSMVSDLPWMQDITMLIAERLRKRGVPVYLFHGRENAAMSARFSHAKLALIDDWTGLGASNFDRRSMVLNLESLLLRYRSPFQAEVEDFFAFLEKHSVRLDESNRDQFRPGWRAYLLYPFRRWL